MWTHLRLKINTKYIQFVTKKLFGACIQGPATVCQHKLSLKSNQLMCLVNQCPGDKRHPIYLFWANKVIPNLGGKTNSRVSRITTESSMKKIKMLGVWLQEQHIHHPTLPLGAKHTARCCAR